MTRLKETDIQEIATHLQLYDKELLQKTGHTLLGIACHAVGVSTEATQLRFKNLKAAALPITKGQGIIGGFSGTVRGILEHLGIETFVPAQSDEKGMKEAQEKKVNLVFAADDEHFIVFDITGKPLVDNAKATGKGFAAGLDLMCGGVKDRPVLVLGCGMVGRSAVDRLLQSEARVSVFDIVPANSRSLASLYRHSPPITIEETLEDALSKHHLIIDATNSGEFIGAEHIKPGTYISAPGMPLGLTLEAIKKINSRLLHDPLQIGVAVMAVEAVY